jgi:hypothetical protein
VIADDVLVVVGVLLSDEISLSWHPVMRSITNTQKANMII